MKIVFMGTPAFAATCMEALIADGLVPAAVFTQPDKPKGRGHKLVSCEVKELAIKHNIPTYQPTTLRNGEAYAILKDIQPDLIVVVAYGRILPDEILALPSMGCINIHGSVLPKYRGSAPIQRSVLNGDKSAGVSSMYMAHEMDAGDIIFTEETVIGEKETSSQLFARLAPIGAALLIKTIHALQTGSAPRIPQDEAFVSFAPPLSKEESPIDWNSDPKSILRKIYGLQDWPCATAILGDTEFKIFDAEILTSGHNVVPGTLLKADKQGIEVACADGVSMLIKEIQAAGSKRMSAAAYLLGHPMEV